MLKKIYTRFYKLPQKILSADVRHVIVKLQFRKRSGIGKLNNPAQRRVMRLKLQKRSALKFVSRIIPHKRWYNTPQLAAEYVSKACFGFNTRD